MKFNQITQSKPRAAAKPSRKKVVALGSPAKEPAAVQRLRHVPAVKLPYGNFLAVAN